VIASDAWSDPKLLRIPGVSRSNIGRLFMDPPKTWSEAMMRNGVGRKTLRALLRLQWVEDDRQAFEDLLAKRMAERLEKIK
jgi:hypothetical protein